MVLHDVICKDCGTIEENVHVLDKNYGMCILCGGDRTWKPSGFNTDVYGSAQYSDATGRTHTSSRDKAAWLKDPRNNEYGVSYQEAGDKVNGARADHTLKGKAFSYAGQRGRTSTAE